MGMTILYQFAASYAMGRPVALSVRLPSRIPKTVFEIEELCKKHSYLELYLWLSLRFPKFFIEREVCSIQMNHALKMIEAALSNLGSIKDGAHAETYKRIRENLRKTNMDDLPPEKFGKDIRNATKANLSQIRKSSLVMFPLDKISPIGSGNDRRSFKSRSRSLVSDAVEREQHPKDNEIGESDGRRQQIPSQDRQQQARNHSRAHSPHSHEKAELSFPERHTVDSKAFKRYKTGGHKSAHSTNNNADASHHPAPRPHQQNHQATKSEHQSPRPKSQHPHHHRKTSPTGNRNNSNNSNSTAEVAARKVAAATVTASRT